MFPVLLNRTKPFSGGAGGESPHVNGSEFNFITSMDCNFELSMTGSVVSRYQRHCALRQAEQQRAAQSVGHVKASFVYLSYCKTIQNDCQK